MGHHCLKQRVIKWTSAFKAKQPGIQLEVGPKVEQPESVDIPFAVESPHWLFAPFTGVKLYYSLGAGVDHL